MEGQFHDKQMLIRDNANQVIGVAVSGPISWGPGDAGATIDAKITQGETVHGRVEVGVSAAVWVFAVAASEPGTLWPDEARASATAHIRSNDGTTSEKSWSQKVQLV
jgi:hypothetical protein